WGFTDGICLRLRSSLHIAQRRTSSIQRTFDNSLTASWQRPGIQLLGRCHDAVSELSNVL
ncbi:MAG: hypothetical protein R6U40_14160, partial [Desulfobacterales bacterium]